MNKIYKVVFNSVTATWQVVSEVARGPAKSSGTSSRSGANSLAIAAAALMVPMLLTPCAMAASFVLSGNYIKIGVNDAGTLGYNGRTSPGILYDGTGTGTFNTSYDYLTPGTPFEGFTVKGTSGSAFSVANNNTSVASPQITGSVTSYSGAAYAGTTYDNRAVWTGSYGGLFSITNDVYFNNADQQVNIKTTITATADLTGLQFGRYEDPDARAAAGDSSATNNFRGSGSVSTADLVYAEALVSKYVIGLYTASTYTHNTGVSSGWTTNPSDYLAGVANGNGDYTIGLGFNIGSLTNGSSAELSYAYIFGTDIAAAVTSSGAGGGGGGAPATPTIDTARASYTSTELSAGSVTPTFSGGTLTLADAGAVSSAFTVKAAGGAINTAGFDSTFSGVISNDGADTTGALSKVGTGTLTLSGANTYTGATNVNAGTLNLTGSLASTAITVDSGASLLDAAGGLSTSAAVTVNGSLGLGAHQAIDQLSGSGNVGLGANTLSVNQGSFSGAVGGTGGLTKAGAGTLTLSGTNTFTGAAAINAGTLALSGSLATNSITVGAGATLQDSNGGLASTAAVSLNGTLTLGSNEAIDQLGGSGTLSLGSSTLTVNQGSFSGGASGTGGLTKAGAGALTISGSNTYTGATNVNAGTLSLASGTVTVASGATLLDSNGGLAAGAAVNNAGTLTLGANDTVASFTSSGTLNGAAMTLTAASYALNNGAVINANLGLGALTSAGSTTLNGSTAASTVNVSGGTLTLGAGSRLASNANVTVAGALALGGSETISQLGGAGTVSLGASTLTLGQGAFAGVAGGTGGLSKQGSGTLTLSGVNTYTGATTVTAGTLALSGAGSLAASSGVANSGTLDISGSTSGVTLQNLSGAGNAVLGGKTLTLSNASGTLSGVISGTSGSLIKNGANKLILSGTSTYTGATTVQGGNLSVEGNLAGTSQVSVLSGATLGGSGRVGGHVLVQSGGTLSPGSSPGVLTVGGNVTLNSGSNFRVEIDGRGLSGGSGGFDRVLLTGTGATFTAGGTLAPVMRGISGAATNTFNAVIGDVFTIVTASNGAITGAFDAITQPTSGGLPSNARLQVIYSPTMLQLAITPDQYAVTVAGAGGTGNAVTAAAALDGVRPSAVDAGTAAVNRFFNGLAGRNEKQIADIFSSLSGQVHATALSEAYHDSTRMRDAIFTRKPTSLCTAENNKGCQYAWLSVDHNRVNVDASSAAYGVRTTGDLISVGVEKQHDAKTTIGLALGIQTGSQTPQSTLDQSSSHGLQLAAYMDKQMGLGQYTQVLGLGITQHDTTRAVQLSDQLARNTASYQSYRVFSDSRLSLPLITKGALSINGVTGLRLDYVHRGAQQEEGADLTSLSLRAHDQLTAQGNLGVALRHTYLATDSHTGYAQMDMTYNHQLNGKGYATSSTAMYGANWSAQSAKHGVQSVDMGLSLSDVGKQHSTSVRVYWTQSRSGISNNGVQLTGGYHW